MTFKVASAHARQVSQEQHCSQHVNVSIRNRPNLHDQIVGHTIDPKGYTVSDWTDGTTVASFSNGRDL